MSTRPAVPTVIALSFAVVIFGLVGNYLGARQSADTDARFAALRAELDQLRRRDALNATGTAGHLTPDPSRAAIIDDVKRQLTDEMGLLPLTLLSGAAVAKAPAISASIARSSAALGGSLFTWRSNKRTLPMSRLTRS